MRTLYICYFNTEEPLVHTQVLPYLRALSQDGVVVHLMTFEKRNVWSEGERARRSALRQRLAADGIRWHALKYHKRPSLLATGADILLGILYASWLILRHRIEIVHARAHVPGVIALPLKLLLRRKLIFDFRGLMAEEYVDNGVWSSKSLPFRLIKSAENESLRVADQIIVLTEKLKGLLLSGHLGIESERISVIPCCTDLSQYQIEKQASRKTKPEPITLAYVGSVTGRYMLAEMIEFFKVLEGKLRGSRFLVITQVDREDVKRVFTSRGLTQSQYSIVSAGPSDIPELLQRADVAISFVKPTIATVGSSPTKIGEYLAAGLPVVSTATGDIPDLFEAEGVGVIIADFSTVEYHRAADKLIELFDTNDAAASCRLAASRHYSLKTVGEQRYVAVYRSLAATSTGETMFVRAEK